MMRTIARSSLTTLLDGIFVCFVPVLWLSRLLARQVYYNWRLSIWTGAPIITVAKNSHVERLLGFDARSLVKRSYYITNEFDYDLSRITRGNKLLGLLACYVSFAVVCVLAEQVHAYMDGGILPQRKPRQFNPAELWLYRFMGVRLLIWTYGGDVRTRTETVAIGEPNCCTDCNEVGQACVCDSSCAKANLRRVGRSAVMISSMGDMIEYTPGSRNDLFFWPVDFEMENGKYYRPVFPEFSKIRPLRVVHAPNHRQFKGTRYLELAVCELKKEGIPIELVFVEGVPNEQALDIYRTADIVFDQCLIGFHGYFAIEAMALGKPVMCFIRDPQRYLLAPEECPILNVHRDELLEVLRRFATTERTKLPEIGKQSRDYAKRYYSMQAFAGRLKKCYEELGIVA